MRIPLIVAGMAALAASPLAMTIYLPPAWIGGTATFVADPYIHGGQAVPKAYRTALDSLLAAQKTLVEKESELVTATNCLAIWPARDKVCVERTFVAAKVRVARARAAVARARRAVAGEERTLDTKRTPGGSGGQSAPVEQGTILVMFDDESSEEQRQDVLRHHGLVERARLASISLYVTQFATESAGRTAEGEATRLRAVVKSLKDEGIVETAVQNVLLGGNVLPRANTPPRDWLVTNPARDPLVISGFPAAWNFNEAIARRGTVVDVGVLDIGFVDPNPADLKMSKDCTEQAEDTHGTIVAAIIGATFDNGDGLDGAAPFARVHGCAPKPRELEAAEVEGMEEQDLPRLNGKVAFDAYIWGLETLLGQKVRLVNASIGYNWGSFLIQASADENVKEVVESQGKMVRKILLDHPDAVVVSAAGNDCESISPCEPATWASPFNWAATGTDTSPKVSELSNPSENVIVVEGRDRTDTAKLPMSNFGGTVKAIGEAIPSIPEPCTVGTSCATPLVTAAIAQMLAVNPNLTPLVIKQALQVSPTLNVFEAIKASSPDFGKDLADYDGSNGVDMADFARFKAEFQANAGLAGRSDFNGDGRVDELDLQVMIDAWTDTNVDPRTLPAKLRE